MKQTNWYVITGAPSSGKTTLLNYLSKLGYYTIPESARALIDREMASGKTLKDIRKNGEEFQKKVLGMKIEVEKNLDPKDTVFLDRGIPDSLAYFQVNGLDTSYIYKLCNNYEYRKVFVLERLEFEKNYAKIGRAHV